MLGALEFELKEFGAEAYGSARCAETRCMVRAGRGDSSLVRASSAWCTRVWWTCGLTPTWATSLRVIYQNVRIRP